MQHSALLLLHLFSLARKTQSFACEKIIKTFQYQKGVWNVTAMQWRECQSKFEVRVKVVFWIRGVQISNIFSLARRVIEAGSFLQDRQAFNLHSKNKALGTLHFFLHSYKLQEAVCIQVEKNLLSLLLNWPICNHERMDSCYILQVKWLNFIMPWNHIRNRRKMQ